MGFLLNFFLLNFKNLYYFFPFFTQALLTNLKFQKELIAKYNYTELLFQNCFVDLRKCTHLIVGQRTNDVRISRIGNGHRAHTEVFTASGAQLNVGATVVLDFSFGQHGVVLNLGLPAIMKINNELIVVQKVSHLQSIYFASERVSSNEIRHGDRNYKNHHVK